MLYKRKKIQTLPSNVLYYPRGHTSKVGQSFIDDARQYTRETADVETQVKTADAGIVTAVIGDYILTDNSSGEKWVCKATNFADVFEEVVNV